MIQYIDEFNLANKMITSETCRFKMILAGIKFEIHCRHNHTKTFCKDYLNAFDKPDFLIPISVDEIFNEADDCIFPRIKKCYPGVAISPSIEHYEPLAVCRKIADAVIYRDAFLMHGSVVAKDGYAYMFTAPSGVGKTTRTRIWLDCYQESIVVNGDKPLIKITSAQVVACGTPWCGKEGWNTNIMVPLRAIFLLERADEGEVSSIEEVSFRRAFPVLLQQVYRPKDANLMWKTLLLLKSLEDKVKFYRFRSTPSEDSIQLAYETAKP